MRIHVDSCETRQCDPIVLTKEKDGQTYYGLRMSFCHCRGVDASDITFWADSLANLHVFTIVMRERVEGYQALEVVR